MIFEFIFFALYRFVFWPAVIALALISRRFNEKMAKAYELRRAHREMPKFSRRPVWIHASSGEFEYARPVIRRIKAHDPNQPVVVTYFSPSYANVIQASADIDWSTPLPLDLPGPVHSFLSRLNPCALLISRTDLWPELLKQTAKRNIPSLLFSATLRPQIRHNFFARFYRRWLFSFLTEIYTVSTTDQDLLHEIGVTNTATKGDTRFDQVFYRLQHPKALKSLPRDGRPLILVAGSTWSEDEAVLLPALETLLVEKKMTLILVPHENTSKHLNALQSQFRQLNIKTDLYSHLGIWTSPVLIVDQVGILAELYAIGDYAFVGGSFRQKVHSVMEPLAAGLMTFVGPYHTNNREAVDFQKVHVSDGRCAVTVVENAYTLTETLNALAGSIENLPVDHLTIRNEVKKRTGSSDHILHWLTKHALK